jgi:Domain of unknown function (DUF4371)
MELRAAKAATRRSARLTDGQFFVVWRLIGGVRRALSCYHILMALSKDSQKCSSRSWKDSWLKQHDWLRFDGTSCWCEPCRQFPMFANKTSILNSPEGYRGETLGGFRYDPIKNHYISKRTKTPNAEHLAAVKEWEQMKSRGGTCSQTLDSFVNEGNREKIQQVSYLVHTAHLIAKRALSLDSFEDLVTVQLQNGCKIGCQYYTRQHLKDLLKLMAEEEATQIQEELASARFISVISDGSNDKGVIEQEAVHVRYLVEGKPKDRFLSLEAVVNGTAPYVFQSIKQSLMQVGGLSVEQMKSKIACLNFDGAAVMQSDLNGVVGYFKREIASDCLAIHCVCHNLELAVGDALKGNNWFLKINDILSSIFKTYYYSPKKYRALKASAQVLDDKLVHFGGLQNIRWLASQQRAWSAMRSNFKFTVAHLDDMVKKPVNDSEEMSMSETDEEASK